MDDTDKDIAYREYIRRVGGERIPVYEPSLGDEELALIGDAIRRNWLSEGKFTREFEVGTARASGRAHALAFCNATAALITGMKALGVGAGDDVIVPSFAHPADPNAVHQTGATPIFADVDRETLCLSVDTVEHALTKNTRAILFVALYGSGRGLDAVADFARKKDLFLVNDCAQAFGGTTNARPIASYGDFSVLSFFADKTITSGEGGMLLTDRTELIGECNIYKHDGRRERGHDLIERIGFNFRMTELQAAVGVAQLAKADEFMRKKKANMQTFAKLLAGIPEMKFFDFGGDEGVVPHRNLAFAARPGELRAHLGKEGIGTRPVFKPMHSQPCYRAPGSFPVTEELSARGICLPSAATLTRMQMETVCKEIERFYAESR